MSYHLRNYLERTGALVSSEDAKDEYIVITADISTLSGLNEGESYILKDADTEQHTYAEFAHLVWRRVVQGKVSA